jgi:GH35 family endo-1,4-beta-xylanase
MGIMTQKNLSRRDVLAVGVGAAVSMAVVDQSRGEETGREMRVKILEADGSPLEHERLRHFHARDMEGDPLPVDIYRTPGEARFTLPNEPVQLVVRLKIPEFGEVYCYADNGGKGYTRAGEVDFVADAAATRLRRVREAIEAQRGSGFEADAKLEKRLSSAGDTSKPGLAGNYQRLANGLWAGEMFAVALARRRIAQFSKPRREVLFSGLSSQLSYYPNLVAPFKAIFNYAPTSWYSWSKEETPPEQHIDYSRMDQSVNVLLGAGIAPKIFGYCYMTRGATPKWMQPQDMSSSTNEIDSGDDSHNRFNPNWPFARLKAEYDRVIRETTARYDGRVHYVEVINEAHDKTNMFGLNHEQILEMTRMSCDAARKGSPTIQRVINDCCLWAEYAIKPNRNGTRRWSPYKYLETCIKSGIEFELVGLQLYYPEYDLFEIDRMLDRFTKLGKTIQITEMAAASQDGVDKQSMRPAAAPGWHGPWSEATQADWAEGIYTLCYSKPLIGAIGWWDYIDLPNHFWSFGGLLHADGTPKEAYHRIAWLQKNWGVGPGR